MAALATAATQGGQRTRNDRARLGRGGHRQVDPGEPTAAAATARRPDPHGLVRRPGHPRVLGPLRDWNRLSGSGFGHTGAGDRSPVLDALRDELTTGARPTVLVLEDLHWADEATLDVLAYLTRRIATLPAIVVLTYRDDEVPADHPLHRLLGLAARVAPVIRLHPARLSLTAVRTLSATAGLDADRLFGITSGNPYFVTK